MKAIPILFERKELCCGCTACFSAYPKKAISMEEDEEGFEYPHINENCCIMCYECVGACPIKNTKGEF